MMLQAYVPCVQWQSDSADFGFLANTFALHVALSEAVEDLEFDQKMMGSHHLSYQ